MLNKELDFKNLEIQSKRFKIATFNEDMAEIVHKNSLDENNRRFLSDEVFETTDDAKKAINYLLSCYENVDVPLVYPVILNTGENIGYVQIVPIKSGQWEIGYHIAEKFTGNGYATEAVQAFLPVILPALNISEVWGVCHGENYASHRVLEKCSFVLHSNEWGEFLGESCIVRKYTFRCKAHIK